MADPRTQEFMKTIKEKAESYGEDKDKFLNFLLGQMTPWYDSTELMIVSMEGIKLMVLLSAFGEGVEMYQGIIRKSHKSETAKPI